MENTSSFEISAENFEMPYEDFIASHINQLETICLNRKKWKTLYKKLINSQFDAGENFIYLQDSLEDSDEASENEVCSLSQLRVYTKCAMDPSDEINVYLIDHAWTYTLNSAKEVLQNNSRLVGRMCNIMDIPPKAQSNTDVVDEILKEMWRYNNAYILQSQNKKMSFTRCWFILDEFGSRIKYSEDPNFALVSFFFSADNMMYSLLFPKTAVSGGEEVTCAYPKYSSSFPPGMEKLLRFPWEPSDLSHLDYNQEEPSIEYFSSGRIIEILPENDHDLTPLIQEKKIKVYSEFPEVGEFLTNPRFYITEDKSKAHILWLCERLSNYTELMQNRSTLFYISQFPSEQVLISKGLLPIICRRSANYPNIDPDTLKSTPIWLPTTFNLLNELPKFISYFQNREKRNLDNLWICKPFNLARGLDISITDNLCQIIRLCESKPMVACKYITDPVLFPVENIGLVKMDLRFIVLLRSVQDFELFVYERFWLRFANKPFSLDDFEDYEKHFTVMNYGDFNLKQMFCHDFVNKFEDFYSDYKWCDIERDIYKMIKDIFIASALKEPPAGIGSYSGSRAMYGLDIMLQWDRNHDTPRISPVLLEVNWMPDCKRACQYYPEFYDDIFSVLFLNDIEGKHVVQL